MDDHTHNPDAAKACRSTTIGWLLPIVFVALVIALLLVYVLVVRVGGQVSISASPKKMCVTADATHVQSAAGYRLEKLQMLSPSEGWAVGSRNGVDVFLHYYKGNWASLPIPANVNLHSVSMISATEEWAVGDEAFVHYKDGC